MKLSLLSEAPEELRSWEYRGHARTGTQSPICRAAGSASCWGATQALWDGWQQPPAVSIFSLASAGLKTAVMSWKCGWSGKVNERGLGGKWLLKMKTLLLLVITTTGPTCKAQHLQFRRKPHPSHTLQPHTHGRPTAL